MAMIRVIAAVNVVLLAAVVLSPISLACSVFALQTEDGPVFGQNLDWYEWFPGHVVVNVREVKKMVLPWKGDWPAPSDRPSLSWTSRYGSVTFTSYGRDFIEGGMNEVGLVVDETNLTAVYPPDDGRPGLSCAQWMQYQLDNFKTVDEVIDHLGDLRPDGEGWHYLIVDANGECAVIEYLNGRALVHTGSGAKVCALTNTTYRQALSHIPMDSAFGGDIDIASGHDAYGRFIRMAVSIRDYDRNRHGDPTDYAFTVLEQVGSDETRRSVVYDAATRRVLWRTQSNPSIRWLTLSSLDFSPSAPTRVIDVESEGKGEMCSKLVEYSVEANREVVREVLDSDTRSDATTRLLAARGLSYDQALEMIAAQPTACAK
jgi:choloylglycine hydrolase